MEFDDIARAVLFLAVDAPTRRAWQVEAEKAYPKLRGTYCPAGLFDEVRKLRDAYRTKVQTTP